MGWLTVVAYGLAAAACGLAARRAGPVRGPAGARRNAWILMTALMAFLCLNKQLDLQSLATDLGRVLARTQGWYDERRAFQKGLVISTLAVASIAAGLVIIRFWRFWRNHRLLLAGIAFLGTFVVVRAISFHHVDVLLRTRVAGVKMNWFLELTGIALIGLAALRAHRHPSTNA